MTKAQVGLGNVDNTSDVNKPVSTAQATADSAVQTAAASDATTKANAAQAAAVQRANHTGTQTASTISDFSTAVTTLGNGTFVTKPARIFRLDDYGADSTGAALSDAAWTAAYTAAAAVLQSGNGYGGAMIIAGTGIYKFTLGTVVINDPRIGFTGQGVGVTTLVASGSSGGDLVYATDTNWATYGPAVAAPIGGFTLNNGAATGVVNGLHYGDRAGANLLPIRAEYFAASATSTGFLFRNDNNGLSERTKAQIEAVGCARGVVFDGRNAPGGGVYLSFDYSMFDISLVGIMLNSSFGPVGIQLQNNAALVGCDIRVRGNIAPGTGQTGVLLQVGTSSGDTAQIASSSLNLAVERSGTTGTAVQDLNITAAAQISDVQGRFQTINGGSSFTAGTVAGTFKMAGKLASPIFSSATGNYWTLSPAFAVFDSAQTKASLAKALAMDGKKGHLEIPTTTGTPVATPSNGNTVTITGTDTSGMIQITTPASGMAAGLQASIAFANSYDANVTAVLLFPAEGNASANAEKWYVPTWAGAVNWGLQCDVTPGASKTYKWRYLVLG